MTATMGTTATTATWATRFGPFTAIAAIDAAGDDIVVASGWTDDPGRLLPLVARPLRPVEMGVRRELGAITRAVQAFDDGDVGAIDAIAVRQTSGPFREDVWSALRRVAPGTPVTYAALAVAAGRPTAVRAAGTACARNAAALFVPCHRAIGADGSLRGFAYGLDVKAALLAHEAGAAGSRPVSSP